MLKNYLRLLKLGCKKFAKKYDVFDIVLYGSAVKGSEDINDIDILLIFNQKKLNERTSISQELKEILSKKIKKVDIKTINLKELFETGFLARQAILIEGYSLLDNIDFSRKLGFKGYSLFTYNLKNLNHNEKTKFIYALIGRAKEGMIKKLNGKHIGRGGMIIPIKNSLIFDKFLKKWNINYDKKKILVSLL